MSYTINIINHPTYQEYIFNDEYGSHQYFFISPVIAMANSLTNFNRQVDTNGVLYTWNDNLSYHQYYFRFQPVSTPTTYPTYTPTTYPTTYPTYTPTSYPTMPIYTTPIYTIPIPTYPTMY